MPRPSVPSTERTGRSRDRPPEFRPAPDPCDNHREDIVSGVELSAAAHPRAPHRGDMIDDGSTARLDRLRILYVATKPAYPPQDGGRLLIWNTLTELAARGHRVTYVAPDLGSDSAVPRQHLETVCESVHLVPARPSSMWWAAAAALIARKPAFGRPSHSPRRTTSDRRTAPHADISM